MNAENLSGQKWNTQLYNDKHSYVFKYGKDVLNLLDPKPDEKILDLGCGNGHLTKIIASSGANVCGIDGSEEMIKQARQVYPEIKFKLMNATNFSFEEKFDAVFSNAVLHWIKESEKVIACVFNSIKTGGKFVAEFGGKNNIKRIETALRETLDGFGFKKNAKVDFWYFPSVAEYTSLLEKHGFTVNFVSYFKRDTFLNEGDNITDWLEMFCSRFFEGIGNEDKLKIYSIVKEKLKATNLSDSRWFVDYVRLRFIASKE